MNGENKILPLQPEIKPGGIHAYYTKSNFFRTIHADGVIGGNTGVLDELQISLWSQRACYPERVTQGSDGTEILQERVAKPGLERELEVSVVMNLPTAKSFSDWLKTAIENAEKAKIKK